MILPAAWVLLSALVAIIATKKGQSAVVFFLLSLILSPLTGLIVVAIMRRPKRDAQ